MHGRPWWAFLALLPALLLAACGGAAALPSESPTATPAPQTVQLFFSAGGKLASEPAQVSSGDPLAAALQLLMQGPKQSGHFSEIPAGAKLGEVSLTGNTAQVSFDSSFFASGGSTGMQLRLAQVVYTATQFPNVTAVEFLQNGQPATVAGGEGFPLNRPLTRSSFPSVSA